MSDKHIYIKYQSDDNEMWVQGSPTVVGEFMRSFLQDENISIDTFTISSEVEGMNWDTSGKQAQSVPDFPSFFRYLNPTKQTDKTLLITYYWQAYMGVESLSVEDYTKAYDELRLIPVKPPTDISSSIQNVIKRTDYLRSADRGAYSLTAIGKEYVEDYIESIQKSKESEDK